MSTYLKIPKVQLAILLVLISVFSLILNPKLSNFTLILISLVTTVLFDLFIGYLRSTKLFIPYAGIVTGLIIGLIIDPTASILQILIISLIAMAVKNFLRISNRHIFNPAASGLVLGGVILGMPVSWWGVTLQRVDPQNIISLIAFLTILLPGYVSLYRLKKYGIFLSFFLVYFLVIQFSQLQNLTLSLSSLTNSLLNPPVLFFSLVMLTEPMTTPVKLKKQILFGALVAILITLLPLIYLQSPTAIQIFSVDAVLIPLLIANLLFFKFR